MEVTEIKTTLREAIYEKVKGDYKISLTHVVRNDYIYYDISISLKEIFLGHTFWTVIKNSITADKNKALNTYQKFINRYR